MNELIDLLKSEFDVEAGAVKEALAAALAGAQAGDRAAAEPLQYAGHFLVRSQQACELAAMQGLSDYLGAVAKHCEFAGETFDPALIEWLGGWPKLVRAYLENPAEVQTVAPMMDYLGTSPLGELGGPHDAIRTRLLERPAAAEIFQEEAQALAQVPIQVGDVSLATDDVDPGLLGAMLADAPDQLERLRTDLQRLTVEQARVDSLFEALRIAHTLKGSGNIIGLPGISRLAHALEDVLEWASRQLKTGEPINPLAIRDALLATETLGQMVAYLQGTDVAPAHALSVLERMRAWNVEILAHTATAFAPPPVDLTAPSTGTDPELDSGQPDVSVQSVGGSEAIVRVSVKRLSALLRRAGQSLYASQRINLLMTRSSQALFDSLQKQRQLDQRLRELQSYVDRQAVNLEERRALGVQLDPLELDRYDSMYSLVRFVAEDCLDQHQLAQDADEKLREGLEILRHEQTALSAQHRELIDSRMVSVRSLLPRLRRNVQQTAAATSKSVELRVAGEHASADANILDKLMEPLLHLVRNAIDHGIESADERVASGKPAQGVLTLQFQTQGRELMVDCSDDGRGLNLHAIRARAIEFGLLAADQTIDDQDLTRFILLPGFSTKAEVTEISGRGVGLDVVNERIQGMGGRLDVQSTVGQGCRFSLRLPVTAGLANGLLVRLGQDTIALPVERVISGFASDQYTVIEGRAHIDQVSYPMVHLAQWLGLPEGDTGVGPLVLARGLHGAIALRVDAIVDTRELVLQDIGPFLRKIPGLAAAALREDGSPLFMIDLPGLEGAALQAASPTTAAMLRARASTERARVLVADDALSVRRALQQLLEDAGFAVFAAYDGENALELLRTTPVSVVLTDLEMPRMNGIELTEQLRQSPSTRDVPVLMITSRASDKHRDLAHAAGVSEFITKPYDEVSLLARIRSFVRLGTQPSANHA